MQLGISSEGSLEQIVPRVLVQHALLGVIVVTPWLVVDLFPTYERKLALGSASGDRRPPDLDASLTAWNVCLHMLLVISWP